MVYINKNTLYKRGMTMVELFVALAILAIVMTAVYVLGSNIFIYNSTTSGSYRATQNSQAILKTILKELRETSPGADGSYPLINTGSTTLSFFSDIDNDSLPERVTYSLIGTTLYKAVIKPSGNPVSYSFANQSTTTLIFNVVNGNSLPSFEYFDTNYTGTSSPLVQPVSPSAVRLIRINQRIDIDPNRSPIPIIFTVQASLRNLKTNL
jgi:prepilin-type N-terminal cleavage/methylation domain-containing protein